LAFTLSGQRQLTYSRSITGIEASNTLPHQTILAHLGDLGCEIFYENQIVQVGVINESRPIEFLSYIDGKPYEEVKISSGSNSFQDDLYIIQALRSARGDSRVGKLCGIVVYSSGTALQGYICELRTLSSIWRSFAERTEGPISWSTKQKWAHELIEGIAQIHSRGYLVGVLTDNNNGVLLDYSRSVFLRKFRNYFNYRKGGVLPPEYHALRSSGSLAATTKTDLFHIGLYLWLLAQNGTPSDLDTRFGTSQIPCRRSATNTPSISCTCPDFISLLSLPD
jgi:hypothetical protein